MQVELGVSIEDLVNGHVATFEFDRSALPPLPPWSAFFLGVRVRQHMPMNCVCTCMLIQNMCMVAHGLLRRNAA